MLLYLVRHGEPDYVTDSLTEPGREQALLVSKRLAVSGIDEIRSSPMGRALETAQPTAELLGLPVTVEPWAYELGEECRTYFPDGQGRGMSQLPTAYLMQPAYRKLDSEVASTTIRGLCETHLPERYTELTQGLDAMLEKLGYRRDAEGFYIAVAPHDRHVALFCHCAMMRVLLAHVLNIPYQMFCATLVSHFTGITVLNFEPYNKNEKRFSPTLVCYGDTGHLFADGQPQNHYWTGKQF